jgi:hypothetical protein
MQNKLILLSLLLFFAASPWLRSERAEPAFVSEVREAAPFSSIFFAGSGALFIQQGEEEGIRVEANENFLPYIKTQITNGTLYIEEKPVNGLQGVASPSSHQVYVTFKQIDRVTLAGQGTIVAEREIKQRDLTIKVSGTGKVDLLLNCENLMATITGSAEYILKGKADNQDIQVSGTCLYDALRLNSLQTSVDIRGSGQVSVNVKNQLNIVITGQGLVRYIGQPKISQKIFGSGKIEQLQPDTRIH